jgi:hypothetical protein
MRSIFILLPSIGGYKCGMGGAAGGEILAVLRRNPSAANKRSGLVE